MKQPHNVLEVSTTETSMALTLADILGLNSVKSILKGIQWLN